MLRFVMFVANFWHTSCEDVLYILNRVYCKLLTGMLCINETKQKQVWEMTSINVEQRGGMRLRKVTPDGNCLFSAATVCVMHVDGENIGEGNIEETRIRDKALELREEVVRFMRQHEAEFKPFMTEDFEAYLCEMEKPHVWGGERELFSIANVTRRLVHVYTENQGEIVKLCEYGDARASAKEAISLLFNSKHYDALLH